MRIKRKERKEENARKKQKQNQNGVNNQLSLLTEKKIVAEEDLTNNLLGSSPALTPKKELTEGDVVQIQRTESQKRPENRTFSKFLNPNFDLKEHQNLVSYIFDYQSEQMRTRAGISALKAEGQKLENGQSNGNHKPPKFSTIQKEIISEPKEGIVDERKTKTQSVNQKFQEYLNRRKLEGGFRDTLDLLQGFKY